MGSDPRRIHPDGDGNGDWLRGDGIGGLFREAHSYSHQQHPDWRVEGVMIGDSLVRWIEVFVGRRV